MKQARIFYVIIVGAGQDGATNSHKADASARQPTTIYRNGCDNTNTFQKESPGISAPNFVLAGGAYWYCCGRIRFVGRPEPLIPFVNGRGHTSIASRKTFYGIALLDDGCLGQLMLSSYVVPLSNVPQLNHSFLFLNIRRNFLPVGHGGAENWKKTLRRLQKRGQSLIMVNFCKKSGQVVYRNTWGPRSPRVSVLEFNVRNIFALLVETCCAL